MKDLYQDGVQWLFEDRNVVVCAWTDAPQPQHLDGLQRAARDLASRYSPSDTALINIILSGKPSFSDEVRERVRAQYSDQKGARLAVAHLILVEGLTGVAARAFVSTSILLARPRVPNKVFSTESEAADWLQIELTRGPEPWTAAQLLDLVREAKQKCGHTNAPRD